MCDTAIAYKSKVPEGGYICLECGRERANRAQIEWLSHRDQCIGWKLAPELSAELGTENIPAALATVRELKAKLAIAEQRGREQREKEIRAVLDQEISDHEGPLRGDSMAGDNWEKAFIAGLHHVKDHCFD